MESEKLRSLQAPLKKRYQEEPTEAKRTFTASGTLDHEQLTVQIDTGHSRVVSGLHEAAGGDGTRACSGDMLLEALVACASVTLEAVSSAMGIDIRGGTVSAEGDIDFRGTLGVDRSVPVGITDIRLHFDLDTDADPKKLDTLLKLTERYCVVYQTLKNAPSFSLSHGKG
jgi:uncharacterized OsmC-like protein